jgi:hypothetical protein
MAFFAAGLSVITLGQAAPAQAAEPSASDCVSVLRTEKSNGLEMSVSNACGRGLACEMRWTLQCETAAGKVTQKAPGASRFAMEASGGSVVTASAAACKDSWTVTEVTWTCAGR